MRTWTEDEETKLQKYYNILPNEELCSMFPEKTWLAIYKKARTYNLHRDKSIEKINRSRANSGTNCKFWKGGKKKTKKGYVMILVKGHERADRYGYVMEHIIVFEQHTGIKVPTECGVHHINGKKDDNRIENLCLMTIGAHTAYHNRERWKRKHEQGSAYRKINKAG